MRNSRGLFPLPLLRSQAEALHDDHYDYVHDFFRRLSPSHFLPLWDTSYGRGKNSRWVFSLKNFSRQKSYKGTSLSRDKGVPMVGQRMQICVMFSCSTTAGIEFGQGFQVEWDGSIPLRDTFFSFFSLFLLNFLQRPFNGKYFSWLFSLIKEYDF